MDVISSAFEGEEGVRLSADTNNNTLIMSGDDAAHKKAAALLKVIDKGDSPLTPRVFFLKHRSCRLTAELIYQMLGEEQIQRGLKSDFFNISYDERLNALIVMGSEQKLALVASLIETLDRPEAEPAKSVEGEVSNCTVRITWLTECQGLDPELVKNFSAPPASLNDLVAGLKSEGFEEVKLITSCSTRVGISNDEKSKEFSNSSTRSVGVNQLSFDTRGAVTQQSGENFELAVSLRLLNNNAKMSLDSTFSVPKNHPLALSVTDFGNLRSVLVIEILDSP